MLNCQNAEHFHKLSWCVLVNCLDAKQAAMKCNECDTTEPLCTSKSGECADIYEELLMGDSASVTAYYGTYPILTGRVHKTTEHIIRNLPDLSKDMASRLITGPLPVIQAECHTTEAILNDRMAKRAIKIRLGMFKCAQFDSLSTFLGSHGTIYCTDLMTRHQYTPTLFIIKYNHVASKSFQAVLQYFCGSFIDLSKLFTVLSVGHYTLKCAQYLIISAHNWKWNEWKVS